MRDKSGNDEMSNEINPGSARRAFYLGNGTIEIQTWRHEPA